LHNTHSSHYSLNFLQNRYFRTQRKSHKYKKIEIILCILLQNHSGIKLEVKSKRNYRKYLNIWRLNYTLLNHWRNRKGNKK
jgi:hypothetical protein